MTLPWIPITTTGPAYASEVNYALSVPGAVLGEAVNRGLDFTVTAENDTIVPWTAPADCEVTALTAVLYNTAATVNTGTILFYADGAITEPLYSSSFTTAASTAEHVTRVTFSSSAPVLLTAGVKYWFAVSPANSVSAASVSLTVRVKARTS